MEKDRLPKPGQIYNHFKNKPYQIITVATHADTREEMVVYQALYGDYKCYIRPLDSFLSEVDHIKYPLVKQRYRFELRTPEELQEAYTAKTSETSNVTTQNVVKTEDTVVVETEERTMQTEERTMQTEERTIQTEENKLQTDEREISYDNIEFEAFQESSLGQEGSEADTEVKSESVNAVLMMFLDAESYYKKLEVITSNRKHMNDRLINDMAVALDCAIDEGPLDQRIQGLIYCLQAMCRFEDKRLR